MKKMFVLAAAGGALWIPAGCAVQPSSAGPWSVRALNASDQQLEQPARAGWAHERSDVRPDPAIRYGTLPNGMKYALRRNVTPPGEAAFRLHIDAGSLMERDDQLGLAHFMEHMVFNGTTNVPEGEFVERLERLGLAFGSDTNASTSFDETIYALDLPETSAQAIDTALLLFRETAGEALLDPAAIDRERGIVLSEERYGASPAYRAGRAQLEFLMKGQLPPKRWPIGTREILKTAPRERFVEFYEAWYRPEKATFVAVGDFDIDALERKVRAWFAGWRGKGTAGTPPILGDVARRGVDVGVYVEPGAASSIALTWVTPPELETDSIAERRETFEEALAMAVFNRRLARIMLAQDPPFAQASIAHGTTFDAIGATSIIASAPSGGWKSALEAIEREQRRAVQYGITQSELDRAIAAMRPSLVSGVAAADTRSSYQLATNLLTGVSRDDIVTTPQDRLALFDDVVRGLDAARISGVLRELFAGGGPLVFVTSPLPISDAERTVARAFAQSRQVAVAAPTPVPNKPWSYTSFGTPGRVVGRREIADLGTTFIRFANGARLTVRPSKKQENEIQVTVRAGDGELDLDPNHPTIKWALRPAFVGGGLGRLTSEEISDALVGRQYGLNINIGEDNFALSGTTQPKDLATQMQLLTAYLTDPAYRALGLERTKSTASDMHAQLRTNAAGVLGRDLPEYLRSGDLRAVLPSLEAMQSTTIEDVERDLAPLTNEPIEVVIVGDVTVEEAIAQTAKTIGALPPRHEASYRAEAARVAFPAAPDAPVRLTHEGRADQAMAYIAWPTDDFFSDPRMSRAASVLARVMRLRLTADLREKQGITYSPGTDHTASRVYPGYGYLSALIEAPAERLDGFFTDTRRIVRDLREHPITQDELRRALQPALAELERSKERNGYWLTVLSGAQRDPRRLDAIRDNIADLRSITPADIQRAAQAYLRDDRAFRIVSVPAIAEAAKQSDPTKS